MEHHCLLIRHAEAVSTHPGGDRQRDLTPEGKARFEALVRRLVASGFLSVDRIITSPWVRARETAEVLGEALGLVPKIDERLIPGSFDGRAIHRALCRGGGVRTAVVGHNPEIAEAIALLSDTEVWVPPGTIASVTLLPSPRLEWMEIP